MFSLTSTRSWIAAAVVTVVVALVLSVLPAGMNLNLTGEGSAQRDTPRPPSKFSRPAAGLALEQAAPRGPAAAEAGEASNVSSESGRPDRPVTLPDGRVVRASELPTLGFEAIDARAGSSGTSHLRRQLLERAGRLATHSDQPWKQLILVALSYRQAQDREAMQLWFDRAIGLASHPRDPRMTSLALRDVVMGFLSAGELDRAEELTQRIPDEGIRELALAQIVRRLAFQRQFERADGLSSRLSTQRARAQALGGLAEAEARFGSLADALAFLEEIPAGNLREQALSKVAVSRGFSGDASGAARLAEEISNDRLRDLTLMRLADLPSGKTGVAPEVLLGLLHDPRLRDTALLQLVAKRAANVHLSGAEQAAARIENRLDYAAAMEFLTSLELRLGDVHGALKRARGISVPSFRNRALEQVALQQVVKQGASKARLTAELIDIPRNRNRALRRIAERSAALGLGREVAYSIEAIDDSLERASAYASVARTEARRGRANPARQLLQAATREIATLPDSRKAAGALSLMASAFAEAGEEDTALQIAATIDNAGLRDRTYQQLARHFASASDIKMAEESAHAIEQLAARERTLDELARTVAGRTPANQALRRVRMFDSRRQQVKFLLEVARRI